ncbi:MAG TPA: hypothetical protein VJX47_05915 [Candidatus Sulfotelmatobacter sp.]|nr:hypothetical protein [Candidatus Sulfotelmatobacter sp.]
MSPKKLRFCSFSALAKTKLYRIIALTTAMLVSLNSFAQTPTPPPADSSVASANPPSTAITVPAGTRIALVLMHPIQSRYVHRGDDIYAQTTSPVVAGTEVVIPPGTFVQGKVDRLERKGSRAELDLQSMSITYPDGYVAPVTRPITLESDDGYALKDPGKGRMIGAFALPAAGLGLGTLIGRALVSSQGTTITNTLPPSCGVPTPGCMNNTSTFTIPPDRVKGMAIGGGVGLAAGGIASLALILNAHNFFLDVGSPVEMTLQHPLTLEQDQVATAIRDAEQHPAPQQPISPRPQPISPSPDNTDTGICYSPGTPGTPDIDIPGTPAVGDSPGTPPIHIPGIPPTPPTPHPCP